MTQEIKQFAIESHPNDKGTLDDAKQLLQTRTNQIRTTFRTKASTAKILAILHECPCLVKCAHEIQSTKYDDIDSLYTAKHEYAKRKLIDAIVDRFADLVTISSEHSVASGKLDIVIMPGGKIILKYNKRIIGIELKSGKSADAKTLYQIERYLPECNILLFVRILTEEVTLIYTDSVETNLIESISRLNRKISRITNGELIKVQGDWCRGCNTQCDYKQPPRWNGESKASLDNFPEFMKNIENVITKTLIILEKELDHTTDKT